MRGCQARDDRDAQVGRRERLDGHVVVGDQATRVEPGRPAGVPDNAEPGAGGEREHELGFLYVCVRL